MTRGRLTALFVAALIALSAAVWLSTKRNASNVTPGRSLLPALASQLNAVDVVSLRKDAAVPTVTLHRANGRWTVAERGDYPADVAKLRKLLTSMSEAKIVEEKTTDPARFASIGVDDPVRPDAAGAEIKVAGKDGSFALIVGKPSGEGVFARRSGESQSFLVEPSITAETAPRDWIDQRLIDIAAASIESMTVTLPGAAPYTLHRAAAVHDTGAAGAKDMGANKSTGAVGAAADAGYRLDGIPAGRQALDAHALTPPSTILSSLSAEDVAPAADVDFTRPSLAVVTLADGAAYTLTGIVAGDKHWLEVAANRDPASAANTRGRAFQIASYRYDGLFRPVEQLLQPKEVPATKAGVGKGKGHATPPLHPASSPQTP